MRDQVCCICGKQLQGWGNSPWPVSPDGKCCDECNLEAVVPARLKQLQNKEENNNEK